MQIFAPSIIFDPTAVFLWAVYYNLIKGKHQKWTHITFILFSQIVFLQRLHIHLACHIDIRKDIMSRGFKRTRVDRISKILTSFIINIKVGPHIPWNRSKQNVKKKWQVFQSVVFEWVRLQDKTSLISFLIIFFFSVDRSFHWNM